MDANKFARAPQHQNDIQSVVQIITPVYARHLRDTAHFDRQRNIRPANVARLAAEMVSGRFTVGTPIANGIGG